MHASIYSYITSTVHSLYVSFIIHATSLSSTVLFCWRFFLLSWKWKWKKKQRRNASLDFQRLLAKLKKKVKNYKKNKTMWCFWMWCWNIIIALTTRLQKFVSPLLFINFWLFASKQNHQIWMTRAPASNMQRLSKKKRRKKKNKKLFQNAIFFLMKRVQPKILKAIFLTK